MKRFAVKMLAAVLLMAVSAVGLAQDNQNEKIIAAVQALCGENVQVLSSSACGSRGAAVVREADGYSLYVGIPFCPSICLYCSFSSSPLAVWRDSGKPYSAIPMRRWRTAASIWIRMSC